MSRPSSFLLFTTGFSSPRRLAESASFGTPSSSAVLRFALPRPMHAMLIVLDAERRVVRTLVDQSLPAGEHFYDWDGLDEVGGRVPRGAYQLRLEADGQPLTARLVTVR